MTYPKEPIGTPIRPGCVYVYTLDHPPGCKGGLYRAEAFVADLPSFQQKVLVKCIQGTEAGIRFVCSLLHFAQAYQLQLPPSPQMGEGTALPQATAATDPQEPVLPPQEVQEGRVVDLMSKGSGY